MTAIYAYASKTHNFAIMGSDDLEGISGTKTDKLHSVDNNRFIAAVFGNDIIAGIFGFINYFENKYNYETHKSVNELIGDFCTYSKKFIDTLYPRYQESLYKGEIRTEDWERITQQSLNLVIIDLVTYEIFQVYLGHTFPPDKFIEMPNITNLKNDVLHRFALASEITEKVDVDGFYGEDPILYLRNIMISEKKYDTRIGNPGSIVLKNNDDFNFISCFKNPIEYIESHFNPTQLMGFTINVLPSIK